MNMNFAHWKGKISVMIVETSQVAGIAFKNVFESIFKDAGYTAEICAFTSDAIPKDFLETHYVDVIICDVSLGATLSDCVGLETLKEWKRMYPGIFGIAHTNHVLNYVQHAKYPFDLYIYKPALSNNQGRSLVVEKLRTRLRLNASAYLASTMSHQDGEFTSEELIDLNRIVRRITYTGATEGRGANVSRVCLSALSGGYSKATVFRMQTYTDSEFSGVQALLKVALKRNESAWRALEEERANYNRFVRWYLPYYWRPEMLGESDEGSVKAVCYAFVSARDAEFRTLSASIRRGDLESIDVAIETIFAPTFQRWYHPRNIREEANLCDYYNRKCADVNGGYAEQLRIFERIVERFEMSGNPYLSFGDQRFRRPNVCLLSPPSPSYRSCIVHGDMNTRNVFVSHAHELREVTLIDFSETGRGHVFYDFIAFEANLRLDLIDTNEASLDAMVVEERAINHDEPSDWKVANPIAKLRRYAFNNFPDECKDHYLYGLATYCFGLLNAPNLTDRGKRWLAACTCAALLDLEQSGFWSTM